MSENPSSGNLPLHPGGAAGSTATGVAGGPGQELRARRDALESRIGVEAWREGCARLLNEAARATLELTGTEVSTAEMEAVRSGRIADAPTFAAPLAALARLEKAASERDPTAPLVGEVHALATASGETSSFRASQLEPQFPGARLSPPQTIPLRFGELLAWTGGQSGRDLETAPRAALFFARFLEISPFAHANFRVAHLMLTFFARADNQPPIWFEVADAAGISEDVSRAFRFDTAPLTARIETSLERSLDGLDTSG